MHHAPTNQSGDPRVCLAESAECAAAAPARRAASRALPMGSLVAALLVALWLPSGPLMAAALITSEASALHAGTASAGTQRTGQKHTNKSGDLRTLKRLSAALIIAVRSSQTGDGGPLALLRSVRPTDEQPLDRQTIHTQRWTNTAGKHGADLVSVGLAGGMPIARGAGLIALPPPVLA